MQFYFKTYTSSKLTNEVEYLDVDMTFQSSYEPALLRCFLNHTNDALRKGNINTGSL